jgi:hypothetical protein
VQAPRKANVKKGLDIRYRVNQHLAYASTSTAYSTSTKTQTAQTAQTVATAAGSMRYAISESVGARELSETGLNPYPPQVSY